MRSPREVSVTAIDSLSGRYPARQGDLALAVAGAGITLLSCRLWRTAPDWSIPLRQVDDDFIFMPMHGRLILNGEALDPGTVAVIPQGTRHSVTYAHGVRSCAVLALHALVRTPWGAPWLQPGDPLVAALPEAGRWHAEMLRLAAMQQDQPQLATRLGGEQVRRLLVELVLGGYPLRPPAGNLDPRLAAIAATVHADPGGAPPVAVLARRAGISPLRLRQLCHAGLGCAPKRFIDGLRLARAAELLAGGAEVAVTAQRCGYGTVRQLQVRFKRAYGCAPSAWRTTGSRSGI
jgi:AraC-like DNA-binding protein